MEIIKYIIQKFSDTYLLPAVSSTFIAFIYFSYKWFGTNLKKNSLTIYNMFYVNEGKKCNAEKSNILTDQNFPITVLKPMIVSTAALTQLRKHLLSNKMLPVKWGIKSTDAKLHTSKNIKSDSAYIDPVCKVWNKSNNVKDSMNITIEGEPVWDYYDMNYTSSCNNNDLSSKIPDCDFYHSNCFEGAFKVRNDSNIEQFIEYSSPKLVTNNSETIIRDMKESTSSTKYYHLFYDAENCDKFDSIHPKKAFPTNISESSYENPASKDDIPSLNISDECLFKSVELRTTKESSKSDSSTTDLEKDALKREHFENYWEIA